MIHHLDALIREFQEKLNSLDGSMTIKGCEDFTKYREKFAAAAAFRTVILRMQEVRKSIINPDGEDD